MFLSQNHDQTFAYTCTKYSKEEVVRTPYACDIIGGNSYYVHNRATPSYLLGTHLQFEAAAMDIGGEKPGKKSEECVHNP